MKSKKKGKDKEEAEEKINTEATTGENKESVIKEINVDFKDKYIRLYSEFENYRKRTAKEKIDIITQTNIFSILNLLTISNIKFMIIVIKKLKNQWFI